MYMSLKYLSVLKHTQKLIILKLKPEFFIFWSENVKLLSIWVKTVQFHNQQRTENVWNIEVFVSCMFRQKCLSVNEVLIWTFMAAVIDNESVNVSGCSWWAVNTDDDENKNKSVRMNRAQGWWWKDAGFRVKWKNMIKSSQRKNRLLKIFSMS